jgi:hypothetical protein
MGLSLELRLCEVWIPTRARYLIYGYPLEIMKQYENKYQVYA